MSDGLERVVAYGTKFVRAFFSGPVSGLTAAEASFSPPLTISTLTMGPDNTYADIVLSTDMTIGGTYILSVNSPPVVDANNDPLTLTSLSFVALAYGASVSTSVVASAVITSFSFRTLYGGPTAKAKPGTVYAAQTITEPRVFSGGIKMHIGDCTCPDSIGPTVPGAAPPAISKLGGSKINRGLN